MTILIKDHLLLRCVTDLGSFRAVIKQLLKQFPDMKSVVLPQQLVDDLCAEQHELEITGPVKELAGAPITIFTPDQVVNASDEKVLRDWIKWREDWYGEIYENR